MTLAHFLETLGQQQYQSELALSYLLVSLQVQLSQEFEAFYGRNFAATDHSSITAIIRISSGCMYCSVHLMSES